MGDVKPAICFIGFGEAGQAVAAGLREAGAGRMSAWDILFPGPAGERLRQAGETTGVRCASSAGDPARGSQIVISAVTAAASVAAAQSVKAHLAGQPFLPDINSVSPGRNRRLPGFLATAPATGPAPLAWHMLNTHATTRHRTGHAVPRGTMTF